MDDKLSNLQLSLIAEISRCETEQMTAVATRLFQAVVGQQLAKRLTVHYRQKNIDYVDDAIANDWLSLVSFETPPGDDSGDIAEKRIAHESSINEIVCQIQFQANSNDVVDALEEKLSYLLQVVLLKLDRIVLENQRDQQQANLSYSNYYDTLTALPNRQYFNQLFDINQRATRAADGSCQLVVLDIDNFRFVDDEYGAEVADALLKSFATRLVRFTVEYGGLAARLSSDEFVLMLPGISSQLLEDLFTLTRQPLRIGEHKFYLSCSAGVSQSRGDKLSTDSLLRQAERAMHDAKERGKDRYVIYDATHVESLKRRQTLTQKVEQALKSGQLALFYQAKMDIEKEKPIGYEALLRWHDREQWRSPAEFLPSVEGTPLEKQIGEFVIASALLTLDQFVNRGLDLTLSVNLSAYHFMSDTFASRLKSLKAVPRQVREKLFFEVLESEAIEDFDKARETLQQARELGIRIALDDFGTSYSSLTYFRSLPIDEVKIDRSFINAMQNSKEDFNLVNGIIGLSRSFDRSVVAEGVETAQQVALLKDLGVTVVQGFYYHRPQPFNDLNFM